MRAAVLTFPGLPSRVLRCIPRAPAGEVPGCIFASAPARDEPPPPVPLSLAWAEPAAARWVDGDGSPTAAWTSARSPALGIRRGARGWAGAVCFHRVDLCILVGLS